MPERWTRARWRTRWSLLSRPRRASTSTPSRCNPKLPSVTTARHRSSSVPVDGSARPVPASRLVVVHVAPHQATAAMTGVLHDPSVANALSGRGGHHPPPQREALISSRVEPRGGGGSTHDASDGLRSQPGLGEPSVTIHPPEGRAAGEPSGS